jgi:peptidyl-prolyl cis-trans isomerase C
MTQSDIPAKGRSRTAAGLALGFLLALLAYAHAQSPAPSAAAKEIRVRQILVDTEEEAKEIAAALKSGGDFAELVKRSKEVGAVQRGGDLGYIVQGYTLPAFWAAALALEPGQISEPLQTEFGWHVIKLEDKRDRPSDFPPPRRR